MARHHTFTFNLSLKTVLLVAFPVAAWYFGRSTTDWFSAGNAHLFLLQFLSLFIEAAPFLLFGSIVSGLIESFVNPDTLLRFTPRTRIGQVAAGSCLGLIFPVCECGVVPVVRRLIRKGMPATMAIAFLLGAPVMNPIVLFATYKAFGLSTMLLWRVLGTLSIACIAALLIAPRQTVRRQIDARGAAADRGIHSALLHAADDFLGIAGYLVIGSVLACIAQVFIPQSVLLPVSSHPVLSVLALELLAFVMSICSSVDAFIALGFASTFTGGSVLSFLVFGPMVDTKSTLMFLGVFSRKTVIKLIIVPLLFATILGIGANLFGILS